VHRLSPAQQQFTQSPALENPGWLGFVKFHRAWFKEPYLPNTAPVGAKLPALPRQIMARIAEENIGHATASCYKQTGIIMTQGME
jgi:hypothetical protein